MTAHRPDDEDTDATAAPTDELGDALRAEVPEPGPGYWDDIDAALTRAAEDATAVPTGPASGPADQDLDTDAEVVRLTAMNDDRSIDSSTGATRLRILAVAAAALVLLGGIATYAGLRGDDPSDPVATADGADAPEPEPAATAATTPTPGPTPGTAEELRVLSRAASLEAIGYPRADPLTLMPDLAEALPEGVGVEVADGCTSAVRVTERSFDPEASTIALTYLDSPPECSEVFAVALTDGALPLQLRLVHIEDPCPAVAVHSTIAVPVPDALVASIRAMPGPTHPNASATGACLNTIGYPRADALTLVPSIEDALPEGVDFDAVDECLEAAEVTGITFDDPSSTLALRYSSLNDEGQDLYAVTISPDGSTIDFYTAFTAEDCELMEVFFEATVIVPHALASTIAQIVAGGDGGP